METKLKGQTLDGGAVAASGTSAVFLHDTVLGITWLRDADVDGAHDRDTVNTWANSLVVSGLSGWLLAAGDDDQDSCGYWSGLGYPPDRFSIRSAFLFFTNDESQKVT